jgi:hypothetical protein
VDGSGDLEIRRLDRPMSSLAINGSGEIEAGQDQDLSAWPASGSGDAELDDLKAGNADVSICQAAATRLFATNQGQDRHLRQRRRQPADPSRSAARSPWLSGPPDSVRHKSLRQKGRGDGRVRNAYL